MRNPRVQKKGAFRRKYKLAGMSPAALDRAIALTRERLTILLELKDEPTHDMVPRADMLADAEARSRKLLDGMKRGLSRKEAAAEAGLSHASAKLILWKRFGSTNGPQTGDPL